jgi:hypothetical protein
MRAPVLRRYGSGAGFAGVIAFAMGFALNLLRSSISWMNV